MKLTRVRISTDFRETGKRLREMENMKLTIYIYCNETGKQVASHTAETYQECEAWLEENYDSNDYHYSYVDVPVSNAV